MSPAKLGINLQTLFISVINFVLPHLFLHPSLLMGNVGSLIANAHVRALAIVEQDVI